MMQLVFDILTISFVLFGTFFMLVGAVGIVRLPDTDHRLHASTKCATLGLAGLLLAVIFQMHNMDAAVKAMMVIVFAFVANPVGSHMLARAALRDRAPQWPGTLDDEHAKSQE